MREPEETPEVAAHPAAGASRLHSLCSAVAPRLFGMFGSAPALNSAVSVAYVAALAKSRLVSAIMCSAVSPSLGFLSVNI